MPLGPIHNSGSGGSSAWGDITGTLNDQTDLKNVLAAKAPLASPVLTVEDSSSTLALTDMGKWLRFTNPDAVEVTIPAQSDVTWPADVEIFVEQAGEGTVTIVGDTGVTLNGAVNTAGQFAALALKRIAEDEWTVIGGVE